MPTLRKPRKRHRTKPSATRRSRSAACTRSSSQTIIEHAPLIIPPTNIVRPRAFFIDLPDNKRLLSASGVVDLGLNAVSREDSLVIVPVEFNLRQDGEELIFGLDATLNNSTILLAPNSINTFNRNPSEFALINGEVRLQITPDETSKRLAVTGVVRVRGASMGRFGYTITALITG